MLGEAAFEAQPKIVTQDGPDADVIIQSQWQDSAEAETQLTAHSVALPNAQVCSGASHFACKGPAARHHFASVLYTLVKSILCGLIHVTAAPSCSTHLLCINCHSIVDGSHARRNKTLVDTSLSTNTASP